MVPKLRKRRRILEKPSTKNWFDLPFEMREMIIDRMDARTRGRFAQCSKLCEEEVTNSKNYLYGVSIDKSSNHQLYIRHNKSKYNYCLEFVDISELTIAQSVVIYKTGPSDSENDTEQMIKWTKIVDGNAEDVRKRYLQNIIEKYKKSIKSFAIGDSTFSMAGFNIKGLRSLTSIIHPYSKTGEDLIETGSMDLAQIMRMDTVFLPNTRISFEDILRFDGSLYFIRSDDFNEDNIKKYLKMWKNGEIHENVVHLMVKDEKFGNIDCRNIIEGLDVFEYEKIGPRCQFQFNLNYERDDGLTEVNFSNVFLRVFFVKNGINE